VLQGVKYSLVTALGLVLLVEGITPFLFSRKWRAALLSILQLSDGQIRFLDLLALISGLIAVVAVHLNS
jgi:uncharacterized protein YjeT (DUF2065 family)